MQKAKDFRDQTIDELEALLSDMRKKLFELVNAVKFNKKAEKPHLISQTKKEIARLHTVITEKRAENQQG
jgi:large subunit ribosomal protein L29